MPLDLSDSIAIGEQERIGKESRDGRLRLVRFSLYAPRSPFFAHHYLYIHKKLRRVRNGCEGAQDKAEVRAYP